MSSVGVNVLRYSALAFGVFYGVTHSASIRSSNKAAAVKHEYEHKNDLIKKAKEEYAKKTAPPSAADDVISNPEDPKFDLEKFLNKAAASS